MVKEALAVQNTVSQKGKLLSCHPDHGSQERHLARAKCAKTPIVGWTFSPSGEGMQGRRAPSPLSPIFQITPTTPIASAASSPALSAIPHRRYSTCGPLSQNRATCKKPLWDGLSVRPGGNAGPSRPVAVIADIPLAAPFHKTRAKCKKPLWDGLSVRPGGNAGPSRPIAVIADIPKHPPQPAPPQDFAASHYRRSPIADIPLRPSAAPFHATRAKCAITPKVSFIAETLYSAGTQRVALPHPFR